MNTRKFATQFYKLYISFYVIFWYENVDNYIILYIFKSYKSNIIFYLFIYLRCVFKKTRYVSYLFYVIDYRVFSLYLYLVSVIII